MKQLRIVGTRPADHPFPLISWLIRGLEGSKISHVGILFFEDETIFNAHFNNLQFENRADYYKKHELIYEVTLPVTNAEYDKVMKKCKDMEGKQSGYWITLFGAMVPHILRRMFKWHVNHPFPKGFTCSWLLRDVIKELGFEENKKVDPPNTSTMDVVEHGVNIRNIMPKSRFK